LEPGVASAAGEANLMIERTIGVAEEHAYSVNKIDSDYFDEA
jgi:restriction endonuclease Mrr